MKSHTYTYLFITAAALVLSPEWGLAADNTPPAQAAPGSAESKDTKTQDNTPAGPNAQPTASIPNDSKNSQNVPAGTDPNGKNQAGVGAKSSKKHHHHHAVAAAPAATP